MKCILRIGFYDILLPDHKGIEKVVDMLSKGAECRRDYGRNREIVTITGEVGVEVQVLPASVKVEFSPEMEGMAEKIVKPPKGIANRQKALPFKKD